MPNKLAMPNKRDLLLTPAAWRVVTSGAFSAADKIHFTAGVLSIERGNPGSGVCYRGPVPRMNYRVAAEARRVDGADFFYGLTFPINDQHASLIMGGWSGGVWGVSNLDGLSAVENETTGYRPFEQDRWYRIVLTVEEKRTTVELDDETIIDYATAEHQYSVWPEQAVMVPLGIATWNTGGEIRQLTLEQL